MKRIVSMFLSLIFVLSVFTGITVFAADADFETTTYNPVEITMVSKKEYKNPYSDVKIDAVFTHEDGTQVKTPGFWKEGSTFAVRFSPTKVGLWSFTVTSDDAENENLKRTGTVKALENDGSSDTEKHGFITIPENKRYFTYEDGTPFFYLGDTNWQAPNYVQTNACNYPGCKCGNQFKHEVDNRIAKGFNVYQTYFDSAESDGGGQQGKLPGIWARGKKHTLPNAETYNDKIDYMFKYLHDNGMVVALGFGVHSNTMNNMTESNYLNFVRYIVARYSCYSIMWIAGQEITGTGDTKTPGKKTYEVYMAGQELVDELDGYRHSNGTHMFVQPSTNPVHTELDNAPWHQWWAVQGGHSALPGKNYYKSYFFPPNTGNIKPYVEAEANYEDINCGGFVGYDLVRQSAWNAIVNGCAGYTYGTAGIWANCYGNEGNTGWYGISNYSYEPWYMGLDKPGGYEMKYMKEFYERLKWYDLVPRFTDTIYADFADQESKDISTNADMSTVVCYFSNSDKTTGELKQLKKDVTYKAYWYDTLTGKYIVVGDVKAESGNYKMPEKPSTQDWVFLLTTEDIGKVNVTEAYKDIETDAKNTITGKLVTPVKVTAVGGIKTVNLKKVDNTAYLYDLSGENAWEPLADRVTQTIIYDLGVPYSLTHLTITPETGTVLPKYRIEVSNDLDSWNILVNTALRENRMSADGTYASEALKGNYRYVKIILLNAQDLDPKKIDVKNPPYEIVHNIYNNQDFYYSHTAIAEISVFADKIAEKADTDVSVGTETPAPDNGTKNDVEAMNTGAAIAIIAGAAAVGIVIGIVVALVVTKKKKQ